MTNERFRPLSRRQVLFLHLGIATLVAILAWQAISTAAYLLFLPAGAIVAAELGAWLILSRRVPRVVQGMADMIALFDAGRREEALRLLDDLCARTRWIPNLDALLVLRRGSYCLSQGDLPRAQVLLQSVVRSGWLGRRQSALHVAYPGLCAELAITCRLLDDPAAAERWKECAHAHVSEASRGSLVLMDALLLAREGQFGQAYNHVGKVGAAGRIPLARTNLLRWIVALAASKAGISAVETERLIAAAKPATQEALAVAPFWPELGDFVRSCTETAPVR